MDFSEWLKGTILGILTLAVFGSVLGWAIVYGATFLLKRYLPEKLKSRRKEADRLMSSHAWVAGVLSVKKDPFVTPIYFIWHATCSVLFALLAALLVGAAMFSVSETPVRPSRMVGAWSMVVAYILVLGKSLRHLRIVYVAYRLFINPLLKEAEDNYDSNKEEALAEEVSETQPTKPSTGPSEAAQKRLPDSD